MAELAKVLGLPALIFYGTGLILGAGIYSILGAAAGEAGRGLWLSFLLAAAVAALSALAYAELVSMFPRAGAEYQYVREAFPRPRAAAGATGLVLAASATASAATVALAFGGYLRLFFDVPAWAAGMVLLAAATGLNLLGVRESSWANILLTLVEVGGLLLVVGLGATGPGLEEGVGWAAPAALLGGAGLLFFAFLGFEDVANLAEEAKRRSDPPRAILASVGIAGILYVLVALAAVAMLPPDGLASSGSPLADAVARHDWAVTTIGAVALFATANTALISMIAGSRLLFATARGGDVPGWIAKVMPGRRSPWVAALLVGAAAAAVLPLGDVRLLGASASLAALIAFVVVDACVIRLRFSRPDAERPFRVRGTVARVPVAPALGALGAVAFASQLPWGAFAVIGAAAVLIVALLALGRRGE